MNTEVVLKCRDCNKEFNQEDLCIPVDFIYTFSNLCRYCSHDRSFKNLAICYILNIYKLRSGEYSDELLEIETIKAKLRWAVSGKDSKYITFKNVNMITQVNNSTELRQALNENLHALITKKRKLLVAKEVNNTLGKIQMDVKMELMQNALTGEKKTISWFDNKRKIGEQYGATFRIKERSHEKELINQ